jgi:methionyl aminopeptidase
MIHKKSDSEIEIMRQGGKILSKIFEDLDKAIKMGLETSEIDKIARILIKKHKVESSFLGYRGYPAAVCCSVNEEVVHGIPGNRILQEGDIVGVDLGIKYKGFHVDRAKTFGIGKIAPIHKKLISVTEQALCAGIEKAKVGNYIRDISKAVQEVAERAGFSVVRDCTGHGVGAQIHEEPIIPNYDTGFQGMEIKAGMTLAIEPMLCERGYEVKMKNDNWTVVTKDGGYSAHFEETVAVTDTVPEILTK